MAQDHTLLCAAGNVDAPAYLVLRRKGYTVSLGPRSSENPIWYAENEAIRAQSESLIEVLGLVCMYESRGTNWAATDSEIDDFLMKYTA